MKRTAMLLMAMLMLITGARADNVVTTNPDGTSSSRAETLQEEADRLAAQSAQQIEDDAPIHTNRLLRIELREIKSAVVTNINDAQSISITGFTLAQSNVLSRIRREVVDSNQTQRDLIRVLRAMMGDE